MREPLNYTPSCDAPRCTRSRQVEHDAVNAGGWLRSRAVPGHPVDLCPEHRDLDPAHIVFGPPEER